MECPAQAYSVTAAVIAAVWSLTRTPSPCMKRSRICTGSRSVAPTPGLSSMRAAIRLGPPSERRREQPLELVLVGRPGALGDAAGMRDRDRSAEAGRGLLAAGDLIDAVVPDHDGQVFRPRAATVARQPSCIRSDPSPSSATTWRFGCAIADAERDRHREPHAAQHVEILRPLSGRPQIEIGVADAADHRFVALELPDQALGQIEAVHHLGVLAHRARRVMARHAAKTLPPVNSGDRMKATGGWIATACLIERSRMKPSSSWRVMVW